MLRKSGIMLSISSVNRINKFSQAFSAIRVMFNKLGRLKSLRIWERYILGFLCDA
jgi:hypothetical protein